METNYTEFIKLFFSSCVLVFDHVQEGRFLIF